MILEIPDSLLMLNRTVEEQNLLSIVTPEELKFLFDGLPESGWNGICRRKVEEV